MAGQPLDLFVLNGYAPNQAFALARRGPDSAFALIDLTHANIQRFVEFSDRVERTVLGAQRPTEKELDDIGRNLFEHIFKDEILELYNRLPVGSISIQIATNEQRAHRIPWEFLAPHNRGAVPSLDLCVVRVLPMCARADPAPSKRLAKLRVLLAIADPVEQPGVPWSEVETFTRRAFEAQTGSIATLTTVAAASIEAIANTLNCGSYDVFHFLGHGSVVNGEGKLFFVDIDKKKSDAISAHDIACVLAGQDIKLAILSACLSGAGKVADNFGPVAVALLKAGIPAVVANQMSIPTKSIAPFAGAMYQKLLNNGNIDDAVMAGRVALKFALREYVDKTQAVVEWGIPALYRWPGGAQLFC